MRLLRGSAQNGDPGDAGADARRCADANPGLHRADARPGRADKQAFIAWGVAVDARIPCGLQRAARLGLDARAVVDDRKVAVVERR